MGRVEKRKFIRDVDKKRKIIEKFTPTQLEVIDGITRTRANEMVNQLKDRLDNTISAAFLLETDMDMSEINRVFKVSVELMEDHIKKVEELENSWRDEEMAKTMKKEIEEKVKATVERLIGEGLDKKNIIQILETQFPTLSKSMLVNAYARIKEEISVDFEDETEKAAAEEILNIIEGKDEVKPNLPTPPKPIPMPEVKPPKEEPVTVYKVETPILKVLEERKILKLEGENGHYEADSTKGVVLLRDSNTLFFENVEQIDEFMNEFKQVFAMLKAE